MYGIPKDLDLSPFVGSTLIQVCIGPHDLQLYFAQAGEPVRSASISIWSHFELRDRHGVVVESGAPSDVRTRYTADLLNVVVSAVSVERPSAIALTFETGHTLRVTDDSERYESFAIQPGDVIV